MDTGEVRTTDQGSSGTSALYRAGILLSPGDHVYAGLSAEVSDPPVTFGEADCAPWQHICSTRDIGDATAVITGDNGSSSVLVEVYGADRGVFLRLRVTCEVTADTSLFWQGGASAPQIPLSVDSLVALADSLATHPA
ncbi:hypothetical protein QRX50_36820 [Amycolatopsis carbonis]|uniref:Uncharacterized protein n=1 Tax=Amycolatopsis carbonis TaxID=715471 RepID=A0A9Y2MVI7_9PSEU|nr:hypothetical protein [Amycolatopsis sp. 2-15]WIX76944.1 hypothetical protein QRX50_36820 [Amycolatopsis sp. 2-15]